MISAKFLLGLSAVVLACTVASTSGRNVSECLANPTGKLSLDIDVVGIQGPQGAKGEQGPIGFKGQKGQSGEKGVKGSRGYPGERGPVGVPGHTGATGEQGHQGDQGIKGQRGEKGSIGVPGHSGAIGPRGFPGDTELTQDEFNRVVKTIQNNISSIVNTIHSDISSVVNTIQNSIFSALNTIQNNISALTDKIDYIEEHTKCGIYNQNWRRVAHIDTTVDGTCPPGLREVQNHDGSKRACGRTVDVGCSSITYPSGGKYTHICGRARGYQHFSNDGFRNYHSHNINGAYVDGLSITRGSPRKHVWTYAVGLREDTAHKGFDCPCATSSYYSLFKNSRAPFVGNDYYCETGFIAYRHETAWNDPLWDGEGCVGSTNTCCQRFGWFHKEVPTTSDTIEVRWCEDESRSNEDVYTDLVEIWIV